MEESGPEAMLDDLVSGLPGPGVTQMGPEVEAARARLGRTVTVAVSGRRGAGKTTVVNELLCAPVAEVGYSADDRLPQVYASEVEPGWSAWAATVQVGRDLAGGARVLEVPEHLMVNDLGQERWAHELAPDVLMHVARQSLRTDELAMLGRAQRAWSLGPLETLVVGTDESPAGVVAATRVRVREHVRAVVRLVRARRCEELVLSLAGLAARSEDQIWADRLINALERVSLTPQGHVLRERWALGVCLDERTDVPRPVREEMRRCVLDDGAFDTGDPGELLARARHWQGQVAALPPVAAEVARVVARSLHLRARGSGYATAVKRSAW